MADQPARPAAARAPEVIAAAFTGGWFHSADIGRIDPDGFACPGR